ncbi:DNA topoisomerase [Acinetobacter lwoffii]|uniref:DNA topoisomerase n=1 Tax=Acinetobacter lwoffii TaxID=28090 RepID=UPI00397C9924
MSQEARRALDPSGGLSSFPYCRSNLMGQPSSAGRVQSPAVLIVVLREIEIQKFKVTNHFGVNLSFDKEPKNRISQWLQRNL